MFSGHKRIKLKIRNQGERSLECHQKYKTNFQRIYGSEVYHVGFKKIFQVDIKWKDDTNIHELVLTWWLQQLIKGKNIII